MSAGAHRLGALVDHRFPTGLAAGVFVFELSHFEP